MWRTSWTAQPRRQALVAAMRNVHDAVEAADALAADGIAVEVIDVRTIRPLDVDTIVESVARTNRLLVVDESPRSGGWSAEVLASVTERALDDLDDAWRIAAPDRPIPYSPPLEDDYFPSATSIAASVRARFGVTTAR